MPIIHNINLGLFAEKPLLVDIHTPEGKSNVPVAIFLHGFKGFKDWGYFPRLPEIFAKEGVAFVSVNFSHNGVTSENSQEFDDLDAFAANTISQELIEIKAVMEWLILNATLYNWNPADINIIGHSRGAGDAIVYAASDIRINKVVLWSPISDFGFSFANTDKAKWKAEGKIFIPNARTGQQMPLNYSFFEDLEQNANELNILEAAASIEMPLMILHGEEDESVPMEHAEKIYEQCLHAVLIGIPGGTHTFNAGHPWDPSQKFPFQLQEVLVNTIEFIKD